METSEWWHAYVDRTVPGDEIGPNGNNPGAGGGRNLHLRTSVTYAFPDPLVAAYRNSVAQLEADKCVGWDGTQLVSARGAASANE